MKIAILDDYQDTVRKLDCYRLLQGHEIKIFNNTLKSAGQLAARMADIEALVLIRERTRVTSQLLDKLPRLKIISQTGRVSRDPDGHIDLEACTDRSVAVLEGESSPVAPAELTWALIMTAQRRIPQYIASLKHGAWQQSGLKSTSMPPNFGIGRALRGQTLGVFGYGAVGQLVAGYARAFGMRVLVWGREPSRMRARAEGCIAAESKEMLFEQSDVLSVHLRLSDSTRGLITAADFARMKSTALFVNTSRAELIAENSLAAALNRGRPGMAAIDVFETEPILQGHALLRMENCICTPHLGDVEREHYERDFSAAFQNILDVLRGQADSVVNRAVLGQTPSFA